MSAEFNLGIQSFCFRKFPPIFELIGALKQAELSYVEIWPKHLFWSLDKTERKRNLSALKENGITMRTTRFQK